MTRSKSRREVLLGAAALAGTASSAAHGIGAGEGPHRCRHLGRRLRPPAQQEHRGADPHQGRLGGGAGPGRRSRAALENARRAAAAARHVRCAGPFGAQHVPDARCRHRHADRLRQAQECRQSAAGDEISLRRRPHLFGQGRRLQSEDDHDRARQLQGRVRSRSTATSSASSTSSTNTRWSARRSPPAARSTISSPARNCCWNARMPACGSIRPTRRSRRA